MAMPAATDPAGVWQAWVAAGRSDVERYARFGHVPAQLKPAVASHMKTVKAIEQYHQRNAGGQENARAVAVAHRRFDRDNPYGG